MGMKTWKKGLSAALSVSTLVILVTGCASAKPTAAVVKPTNNTTAKTTSSEQSSPSANTSSKPTEGGNITIDSTQLPKDLDPAVAFDMGSSEAIDAMYDQLVMYKGTSTRIAPMAAKSYTISKDGKVYTFHLHQNIHFWNGDPMTAQSFVDEFYRVLNAKTGSPGETFVNPIIQGSAAYYAGKAKTITGISAPDKYTLVIKLNKPEPFFLDILTMSFFSAVDKKFIDSVGKNKFDSQSPMGTGAFELKRITTGENMVLTKNPHYWRKDASGNQLPYLNQVTIDQTKSTSLQSERFQQDQTAFLGNLTTGIPTNEYPAFLHNPKLKKTIQKIPMVSIWYVDMNVKDKPFNNKKVRQALEWAVNKQMIIKILKGRGVIANQPTPPMLPGYNDHLPAAAQYGYNPEKAKKLLTEAGYPHGFSVTLQTFDDPTDTAIITSIASDLSAIGVKCKPQPVSGDVFLTNYLKGKVPFFFTGYNQDFPDASDFLNTEFNSANAPSTNNTWYKNQAVDKLLNTAQTLTNKQQRIKDYQQINAMVMEDAAQIPIYIPVEAVAVQPWVHGYKMGPNQLDPLSTIWINKNHA